MTDKCTWEFAWSEGVHYTECGQAHEFTAGGVKDNSFRWCPYCGKKIQEVDR